MKSITNRISIPPVSYPCLLAQEHAATVMLATSPSTGVVVHDDRTTCPIGRRLDCAPHDWLAYDWKPYSGTITLSNDN